MVTRAIAKGVQDGWMDLTFPSDPLAENPVYKLKFKNPERFAQEVEKLFPEVNWDEQIQVPIPQIDGQPAEAADPTATRSRRPTKRAARRR
jgi:hypothetical protein